MKILIIGASGGTGQQLLERALAAGHDVTALARTPSKIGLTHERLRVVAGDVLQPESVAAAMVGQEIVLSALGPPAGKPPGTLISDGTRNLLAAMTTAGARRFVFESGLVVSDCKNMNFVKRAMVGMFRAMNRALYDDKVITEAMITSSGLEWIIVRPPTLKHIPARGNYRVGPDLNVNVVAGLSHADVAEFMVTSATDDTWRNQIVDISY